MDIVNFTNNNIRIGKYPYCIDITNITNCHSDNGIVCNLYSYKYIDTEPRIVLMKPKDCNYELKLFVLKWDEQLKDIPDGEIIYDSKQN